MAWAFTNNNKVSEERFWSRSGGYWHTATQCTQFSSVKEALNCFQGMLGINRESLLVWMRGKDVDLEWV